MKFEQATIEELNRSSRKANFEMEYAVLDAILPEKCKVSGRYKTDVEWHLKDTSGDVVAIYNYKDGKNYLGQEGLEMWQLTNWHVGAHSKQAANRIIGYIREQASKKYWDDKTQADLEQLHLTLENFKNNFCFSYLQKDKVKAVQKILEVDFGIEKEEKNEN
jgi:hypothetical protein